MKKLLITGLLILSMLFVVDAEKTYGDITIKPSDIVKVYDGDTFYANLPGSRLFGERIGIRINGIDTPERRTKCQGEKNLAYIAQVYLRDDLLSAHTIVLKNVKRGKYFRIVADVYINGRRNVADRMISKGLAVRYDGGTKTKKWCPE